MNTCAHACFFAYHIQVPPYCSPLPQCGGNLLNQGQLSGNDRFLVSAVTVNKSDTVILCFLPFAFHTETLVRIEHLGCCPSKFILISQLCSKILSFYDSMEE